MDDKEDRNRLYVETASIISDRATREIISGQERKFLQELLDQVMLKRQYPEVIELLRVWINHNPDDEIDLIIKETLINIDFNNRKSVLTNLDIIKDLLGIQGGTQDA